MTDSEFIKRMTFLTLKMCNIYDEQPVDQDALSDLRIEIHEAGSAFNRSHRRRSWLMFAILCLVCLMLGWIIYDIIWAL